MTHQEALDLLNVSVDTAPTVIQEKFQQSYNQLQVLLNNAPTPNLKKLYQRNLQELQEAYHVLKGIEAKNDTSDLPSATPVYEPVLKTVEISPPTAEPVKPPEVPSAMWKAVADPFPIDQESVTTREEKAPSPVLWIIALVVVGALGLVGYLYVKKERPAQLSSTSEYKAPEPVAENPDLALFPKRKSEYVNDYVGILSGASILNLERFIATNNSDVKTTVVIIKTPYPFPDMATYAMRLGNAWNVGDKGAVLVWATVNRKLYLAVSKNLESTLTNERCTQIIQTMMPYFKKEEYETGLMTGLENIVRPPTTDLN